MDNCDATMQNLRGILVVVVCNVVANLLNPVDAVLAVVWKKFLNVAAAVGIAVDRVEVIVGIASATALRVPSTVSALRKLCSLMLSKIVCTVNSVKSSDLLISKKYFSIFTNNIVIGRKRESQKKEKNNKCTNLIMELLS